MPSNRNAEPSRRLHLRPRDSERRGANPFWAARIRGVIRFAREETPMKAAVLTAYGDVDKFELREVPDLAPGPNELKVRVAGASINPIDWKQRGGHYHAYMPLQFP